MVWSGPLVKDAHDSVGNASADAKQLDAEPFAPIPVRHPSQGGFDGARAFTRSS